MKRAASECVEAAGQSGGEISGVNHPIASQAEGGINLPWRLNYVATYF
jgi:hypothetical protein